MCNIKKGKKNTTTTTNNNPEPQREKTGGGQKGTAGKSGMERMVKGTNFR